MASDAPSYAPRERMALLATHAHGHMDQTNKEAEVAARLRNMAMSAIHTAAASSPSISGGALTDLQHIIARSIVRDNRLAKAAHASTDRFGMALSASEKILTHPHNGGLHGGGPATTPKQLDDRFLQLALMSVEHADELAARQNGSQIEWEADMQRAMRTLEGAAGVKAKAERAYHTALEHLHKIQAEQINRLREMDVNARVVMSTMEPQA